MALPTQKGDTPASPRETRRGLSSFLSPGEELLRPYPRGAPPQTSLLKAFTASMLWRRERSLQTSRTGGSCLFPAVAVAVTAAGFLQDSPGLVAMAGGGGDGDGGDNEEMG